MTDLLSPTDELSSSDEQLVALRGPSRGRERRCPGSARALADGGGDNAQNDHDRDELHVSPTFGAEIDAWYRQGRLEGDTRTRSQLRAAALIAIVQRGVEATTRNGDVRPLIIGVVDVDVLMGRMPATSHPVDHNACNCRAGGPGHRPNDQPPGLIARGRRDGLDPRSGSPSEEIVASMPEALGTTGRIGRCDLHGVGPVPVETIRRLLCDGDICRVVLHGDSQPLDVGRRHRVATADQWRTLLAVSGGHCEWPGCDAPADWCQVHHFMPWNADGLTDLENLGFVCSQHHRAVHEGGHVMARGPTGITVTDRHGIAVRPPPFLTRW